jgi:hypothetical protein
LCVVYSDDIGVVGDKDDEVADGSGAYKLCVFGFQDEGSGDDGGVKGAGLCVVDPNGVGEPWGKDDEFAYGSGTRKLSIRVKLCRVSDGDGGVESTQVCEKVVLRMDQDGCRSVS